MSAPVRILMVEDVITDAELVIWELRHKGMEVEVCRVDTREDFIAKLQDFEPDLVLSDFSLPNFDGRSALTITHNDYPHLPFIFVSGTIGEDAAISALQSGATDYILKSNLRRLAPAVQRALDTAEVNYARKLAEALLKNLIEFAPYAIVVVNHQGAIQIVNQRVETLFGYQRNEILSDADVPEFLSQVQEWHDKFEQLSQASPQVVAHATFESDCQRKDGSSFLAEVSLQPLKTEMALWTSVFIQDISERKEQEHRLARLTRMRALLGSINSVILRVRERGRLLAETCRIACEEGQFSGAVVGLLDAGKTIVTPTAWYGVDQTFLRQLAFGADPAMTSGPDIIGTALHTLQISFTNDIEIDPRLTRWRPAFAAAHCRSALAVPLIVNGSAIGVLVLFAAQPHAFNHDEQRLLAELGADISYALEYLHKEEQINYLAYYDALTGLPNRTLFLERLNQLIGLETSHQRGRISVALIDLERFRNVNDTFGRGAGDELLREVARRLRDCLPESTLLARIHADCFGIVMTEHVREHAVSQTLESCLRSHLTTPIQLMDREIRIAARTGIALFPDDAIHADALLRNAEVALKSARASNARLLFYNPDMNARAAEQLSIESRLRRAFEERQFVLHYQPQIDLASGEIIGLEALIRWDEPNVGLVPPVNFIHVLEETGLIVEVGIWVIEQAQRQYQEWIAAGLLPPRIAVNVSQLQVRHKDFVNNVLRIMNSGGAGCALELEITESLFMEGIDQNSARQTLSALRETGIKVAIDDFGTGYSSLSYIARLPIDTLKIDRSFVMDMTTSGDKRAIVATIISLAHSLNLTVVAEGVETLEQRELLRALNCDQIQGFFYSQALAPEQVALLLKSGSRIS